MIHIYIYYMILYLPATRSFVAAVIRRDAVDA